MIRPFYVFVAMATAANVVIVPPLCGAEPYSSDLTRKWAAQREAQMERNRLQEQRNFEKKQLREQQIQSMYQIFNIEKGQGGTDVNSIPERRRPVEPTPVAPPGNTYADFGDGGYSDVCPNPTDGKYYPNGQPYWGYFPGLLGSPGSSSCVVCRNNKWKGLKYTYCSGPYPN